jgi:hypothetical protein
VETTGAGQGSIHWIDALRELMDNYEENAYIVSGEDAHKAKEVGGWTYEQYLTAFQNMEKKIQRIEKARKK